MGLNFCSHWSRDLVRFCSTSLSYRRRPIPRTLPLDAFAADSGLVWAPQALRASGGEQNYNGPGVYARIQYRCLSRAAGVRRGEIQRRHSLRTHVGSGAQHQYSRGAISRLPLLYYHRLHVCNAGVRPSSYVEVKSTWICLACLRSLSSPSIDKWLIICTQFLSRGGFNVCRYCCARVVLDRVRSPGDHLSALYHACSEARTVLLDGVWSPGKHC